MTAYHRHVSSHSSLMNLKVLVPDPQIKLLSAHLYRPFLPEYEYRFGTKSSVRGAVASEAVGSRWGEAKRGPGKQHRNNSVTTFPAGTL